MAATMARSPKLNYDENTSWVYIYKMHLVHNSCSGCVIFKKVVCVEAYEPSGTINPMRPEA
jgi:hypothetical protein